MSRYKKLTLLHSNDMHGDFLAENIRKVLDSYKSQTDRKYGRTISRLRKKLAHPG